MDSHSRLLVLRDLARLGMSLFRIAHILGRSLLLVVGVRCMFS